MAFPDTAVDLVFFFMLSTILTRFGSKVNPLTAASGAIRIYAMADASKTTESGNGTENPLVRECQIYAKKLKDVVDTKTITQEQYDDIQGCRVSIANALCSMVFGEKFDEIAKGYLNFVAERAKVEK